MSSVHSSQPASCLKQRMFLRLIQLFSTVPLFCFRKWWTNNNVGCSNGRPAGQTHYLSSELGSAMQCSSQCNNLPTPPS